MPRPMLSRCRLACALVVAAPLVGAAMTGAREARAQLPPSLPVVVKPGLDDPAPGGEHSALGRRDPGGHYLLDARVNGAKLTLVFDTGASHTVLRGEDAASVGIDVSSLRYSASADTVNGKTELAPVLLSSVTVGGITRRDVTAFVAKPGKLTVNLLGQSFLARIAGYRLDGDRLLLLDGK